MYDNDFTTPELKEYIEATYDVVIKRPDKK